MVPRAVSKNYFNEVCVSPTVINSSDVIPVMSKAGADEILDKWVKVLNSIDDPCVEVDVDSFQIFGIWYFIPLPRTVIGTHDHNQQGLRLRANSSYLGVSVKIPNYNPVCMVTAHR